MATILIVDDLAANRKFLVTVLAHEGHRMLEAADGREGLAAVRAERPDLVITDVLMPIVDGYEFVRQLRLDPATRDLPVVFCTAHYGEREARALALSSGVSDVLTKPASSDEVLQVVARVLSGAEAAAPPTKTAALPGAFEREHLRLLTDKLSTKAEDLRIANGRLRALINIGLDFASDRGSEKRLQTVCASVRDLFSATYVTLGTLDPVDRTVQHIVSCGADTSSWIKTGDPLSGFLGEVVAKQRTLRGDNPGGDPSAMRLPTHHPEVQQFLAAPIVSLAHTYGWICLVGNEGRAFTDEDEQLVMALLAQVGRIYELEQQILERHLAEEALRSSDRLNRNLVEHLPHRILVKDRNSVILFCNANYAKDLGLVPEQVIGRDAFAFYPRDVAQARKSDDEEVMASGKMKSVQEPYWTGGHERWVHIVKVPYRDELGNVIGILVVFEDITERRTLEAQYQQAQKMEAVGRLAGGVAHDFNNLLTVILGYSDLLLADLDPAEPRHADVVEIKKAGVSAAGLTRQLLAFSRKEIIEPTLLDLNAIVADMRSMLGLLIGEDVKIVLNLQPEIASIKTDRGQLEQIVMNLAVNARDAMPNGGTLTIETANVELDENYPKLHLPVSAGSYVALTVTDTGTGMRPEVLSRLFEPFFTTKDAGKGTGLGLATVHGIVARAGGSVNVYSEVGMGTSFKVYFPKVTGDEEVLHVPAPAVRIPAIGETVLLVEDADGLRELTTRMLEKLGYTVLPAANAEEAIAIGASDSSMDAILTDVVMPGGSGPELTKRLIAHRPSLKVIYMSGYTEDAIVQHGVLNPGIAFLHKPFTSDTLGRKMRDVLDC